MDRDRHKGLDPLGIVEGLAIGELRDDGARSDVARRARHRQFGAAGRRRRHLARRASGDEIGQGERHRLLLRVLDVVRHLDGDRLALLDSDGLARAQEGSADALTGDVDHRSRGGAGLVGDLERHRAHVLAHRDGDLATADLGGRQADLGHLEPSRVTVRVVGRGQHVDRRLTRPVGLDRRVLKARRILEPIDREYSHRRRGTLTGVALQPVGELDGAVARRPRHGGDRLGRVVDLGTGRQVLAELLERQHRDRVGLAEGRGQQRIERHLRPWGRSDRQRRRDGELGHRRRRHTDADRRGGGRPVPIGDEVREGVGALGGLVRVGLVGDAGRRVAENSAELGCRADTDDRRRVAIRVRVRRIDGHDHGLARDRPRLHGPRRRSLVRHRLGRLGRDRQLDHPGGAITGLRLRHILDDELGLGLEALRRDVTDGVAADVGRAQVTRGGIGGARVVDLELASCLGPGDVAEQAESRPG